MSSLHRYLRYERFIDSPSSIWCINIFESLIFNRIPQRWNPISHRQDQVTLNSIWYLKIFVRLPQVFFTKWIFVIFLDTCGWFNILEINTFLRFIPINQSVNRCIDMQNSFIYWLMLFSHLERRLTFSFR